MPKPVVRMGDQTMHGGTVAVGCPTVMAGGKPVARVNDMHVCPMVTGLVPHVGGPILPPGFPTVLVGGMPIATLGDMAVCTGPPDTLVVGCPTVLVQAPGASNASRALATAAATGAGLVAFDPGCPELGSTAGG